MRTLVGTIKSCANKTLTFTLINRYGHKAYIIDDGVKVATESSVTCLADGSFSISLYETEKSLSYCYYDARCEGFRARVEIAQGEGNYKLSDALKGTQVRELLKFAYKSRDKDNRIIWDEDLIRKLDFYFLVGDGCRIYNKEIKDAFFAYENFADKTLNNDSDNEKYITNEAFKKFDEYLSSVYPDGVYNEEDLMDCFERVDSYLAGIL